MGIHQAMFFGGAGVKADIGVDANATYAFNTVGPAQISLVLYNDGRWASFINGSPDASFTGRWYDPQTTGIGSSHWIRVSNVQTSGSPGSTFSSPTPGTWTSLSSGVTISLERPFTNGVSTTTFDLGISSSSSGDPLLSNNALQFVVEVAT